MRKIQYTGDPFLDVSLSALCVAAGVKRPVEITEDLLEQAKNELERVLLSDQCLGKGVEQRFAMKQLSQVFPNSELVNPSNWRNGLEKVKKKFRKALNEDLKRATEALSTNGDDTCSICGSKVSRNSTRLVKKMDWPLLEGIVNYYPSLEEGRRVCGFCAFTIRFLPFSIIQNGSMWILHTQSAELSTLISERYGWQNFDRLIATNQPLDFFGEFKTAQDESSILYLLSDLFEKYAEELGTIYSSPSPITVYLFRNGNKSEWQHIRPIPIPNELLEFLFMLFTESKEGFQHFKRELLTIRMDLSKKSRNKRAKFVRGVSRKIINKEPIVRRCTNDKEKKLNGGWIGHALYLKKVRNMADSKLFAIENLGIAIAEHEKSKQLINDLRKATWKELRPVFLNWVKMDLLSYEELTFLIPPNEGDYSNVRDILLAVIYEYQHCQEEGEHFPRVSRNSEIKAHLDNFAEKIAEIGERIYSGINNTTKWVNDLSAAKSPWQIRGAYIRAVREKTIGYREFVFLAPPEERWRVYLTRDYLLAYLFDKKRLSEQRKISNKEEVLK